MKRLKQFYIFPVMVAVLSAMVMIWFFFPVEYYQEAALLAAIPLAILAVGFRTITHQRIQGIRKQLYQILQTLEEFDVDEPQKVSFDPSPFPVFNELNEYLIELIDRIRDNYRANKQFTQNASHELQTPLAIIKGHIELLLQSPNIGKKEIDALAILLQNTNRLSKINSTLILLSKIEHQRFIDAEKLSLNTVTDEVLQNFEDLIMIHGLEIRKNYAETFQIEMSSTLAEILMANLIQNAIRHNLKNGYIDLNISRQELRISNPGKHLTVQPEILFKRFKRESAVEESLGLGLSIIKRICEQAGLEVKYLYHNRVHTLQLRKGS